jgi:hypothetical protein
LLFSAPKKRNNSFRRISAWQLKKVQPEGWSYIFTGSRAFKSS